MDGPKLDEPLLPHAIAPWLGQSGPVLLLLFTILLETAGTLLLKRAFDGYSFMIAAYFCYFAGLTLFSFVLRYIPLFIAYTTWCAVGTIGVSLLSSVFYDESISLPKLVCIVTTIPCVVGLYVLP